MTTRTTDYDAIVIGSGAGGLASALCMARAGQRVLVLEQHYFPGGWCHSFPLEGFLFSPGVHYIGQLQEGGAMRELYEQLGVADHLTFLELNPEGYDRVVVGEERFGIPAGRANYEAKLVERFPHQRQNIARFLAAVDRIGQELEGGVGARNLKQLVQLPGRIPTIARLGFRTLTSVEAKPIAAVGTPWTRLVPHLVESLDTDPALVTVFDDVPSAVEWLAGRLA